MANRGINYFSYINERYRNSQPIPQRHNSRVFISHQKKDSGVAQIVADYLLDAGIDIYFDKYDETINQNDPNSVVTAIKRGIENSSHMLVLFSQNTFGSMWVPWEIGYAYYSPIYLSVLRLKGVDNSKLPDYLKVVKMVMSIWQLNEMIAGITKTTSQQLILEQRIFNESSQSNPLINYIDSYFTK